MPKPTKLTPFKFYYRALSALDQKRSTRGQLCFSGREDGIGAQIHSVYSLHAFAALRNMHYIPSPLRNIAHNDAQDPDWDSKWNRFFNLPQNLIPGTAGTYRRIRVEKLCIPKDGICYQAKKAHAVVDLFPEVYDKVMPELRSQYNRSTSPKTHFFTTSQRKIAMHLRLGDASNHSTRSSNVEAAAEKLSRILQQPDNQGPVEIVILSQGDPAQFAPLQALGAKLCLNEDLFQTFHTLVSADVLCMAKSSLSYAAALLNRNTVFYEPFWHPPLPHWKTL